MLVVIVIISILLVVVIPAVNSLSKSSGGKSAVSNFMNVVEQARTLAITSGNATYLVFADETLTSTITTDPDKYRAKAYIVFQDKDFVPVAVSKWYFLPTGISFLAGADPAINGLMAAKDPAMKFTCPGSVGSTPIALPFIKFDPSGMVSLPTAPNTLFVKFFSGFVNSSGTAAFSSWPTKTSLFSRRTRVTPRSASRRKAAFTRWRSAGATARSRGSATALITGSGSAPTRNTTTSNFSCRPISTAKDAKSHEGFVTPSLFVNFVPFVVVLALMSVGLPRLH